jgi:hypothetical protein
MTFIYFEPDGESRRTIENSCQRYLSRHVRSLSIRFLAADLELDCISNKAAAISFAEILHQVQVQWMITRWNICSPLTRSRYEASPASLGLDEHRPVFITTRGIHPFIFQYLSIQFLNSHMETGTCQVAEDNPKKKSGYELSHRRDHSFLFVLLSAPGKAVRPDFPVLLVQFQ